MAILLSLEEICNKLDNCSPYKLVYGAKEESLKTKKFFASISYYKLRPREHFVHYVFGLGSEGYIVGGVEEILDQTLMVLRVFGGWETMGKKSKLVTRASLCNSQSHGSTMTKTMMGNFSDVVWDVIQANHWQGTPSINESSYILCS